jgi:hypothetical protein
VEWRGGVSNDVSNVEVGKSSRDERKSHDVRHDLYTRLTTGPRAARLLGSTGGGLLTLVK